jgi:hypothetical protein
VSSAVPCVHILLTAAGVPALAETLAVSNLLYFPDDFAVAGVHAVIGVHTPTAVAVHADFFSANLLTVACVLAVAGNRTFNWHSCRRCSGH